MSGVRGVGMPAYAHINYRACPVCGRPTKNFEMHTRNRADHQEFRRLQELKFREIMEEQRGRFLLYGAPDSGQITAMNQSAWDRTIKQLGGSTEKVEVAEKPLPKHAITNETICPRTNQTVDEKLCFTCIDRAAVGSQSNIKYFVCMELKHKRKK